MKKKFITAILFLSALSAQAQTITAHSGAYNTPDNSLEYVQAAIEHQAEILEIDIRMRPNGSIAMAHDEIKSNEEGTDIETVLRMVAEQSHAQINLDVKQTATLPALHALILKTGMKERVFLTGIEEQDTEAAKTDCPGIPYFLNCKPLSATEIIPVLKRTGSIGVNCNYHYATPDLCEQLHQAGYQLSIWTVDQPEDMKRMLKLQPDNITSRNPLEVIRLKKEKAY